MCTTPLVGGIEAGGTKFVCAIGTGPYDIRAEARIQTRMPVETLEEAAAFFRDQPVLPVAIGIGCFGPVDPQPASPTYGFITNTPKDGWANIDVAGYFRRALGIPVVFDTDVNAAVLGEHRWGAAQDVKTFLYLTIGTGIGGGALVDGKRLHGLLHPEMGHILVPRAPGDDFEGLCPYHHTCLEGMANGPSLAARWGKSGLELPVDHAAWTTEAHYLAMAVVNFMLTLSPERVIMGGGVMHQRQLFPLIRAAVRDQLGGYVQKPEIIEQIDCYIVPPDLGDRAGVLGAMALAIEAG